MTKIRPTFTISEAIELRDVMMRVVVYVDLFKNDFLLSTELDTLRDNVGKLNSLIILAEARLKIAEMRQHSVEGF